MCNHDHGHVLENGGDVYLSDLAADGEARNYDRIEFTPGGMVVCINKASYSKDCYPRERIEAIHTHTTDAEEDAEWW